MSKILNVRLPDAGAQYNQQQFNQLVRSLEQVILQLNSTYTPITSENTLGAMSWFESRGESDVSSTIINPSGVAFDAFNRLRVSTPYTIFDSQNRYAIDNQFDSSTTGGGAVTYLSNESSVQLGVGTASGDEVIRQTYRVFPYQPGKSLLVLATFTMGAAKANLRQRVGYFNTQNGVFLQRSGSTISFVLRTYTSGAATETTVNQADWNGDKLDGTGPSGITLDLSKSEILWMDFEWLGLGNVRTGFIINGEYIVCHTFKTANIGTKVYMTTAILPVRYEITNTNTTASSSTLIQVCSSVISEGGYEQSSVGHVASMTSATTSSAITTSYEPLVSIRLASTALNAVVIPTDVDFLPTTSDNYQVSLIKNATLTGASWAASSSDANVEVDIASTSLTGGTVVYSTFTTGKSGRVPITSGSPYNWDLQLGSTISGTSDIYTLAARTITGTGGGIGALSFYDLTQ